MKFPILLCYCADNILYTGEEMRKDYERNGIAAKGRINHANCAILFDFKLVAETKA